jgi:hypothetical protein
MFSSGNVCNSFSSEIPLWFRSCHSRRFENTASLLSMSPSPLPPFSGLSYSARARNPFHFWPWGGFGCGVKLPNSSVPLSMMPFAFRSRASHASSEPKAVQETRSAFPSLSRSKFTPPDASVRLKPFPEMSMVIGVGSSIQAHHTKLHWPWSHSEGRS